MSQMKRRGRRGSGQWRRLALGVALTLVAAACGETTATPPPAEPHTGFSPLEVELAVGPDWMVSSAGSIWVKRDDGIVDRLDPSTGDVIAEIDATVTSQDPCNGLGVSADAIWTCSGSDVVRIDPATNEITATIAVGKVWAQGRLVEAAGRIWVLSGAGDQLVGIATADGTAGDPISLPARCVDLGARRDVVYAVCTDDDVVLRFDPGTGEIGTAAMSAPNHVSATDSAAWVAAGQGLVRLDPTSLATQLTVPSVVPGAFGGILADETAVWVRQEDPFLIRIDARTGAQTHVITAPHGTGDVLVEGERIWASDVEGNAVLRLTVPATN